MSNYFVQNNRSDKDGYRRCLYCNQEFKPNTPRQIYCCRECYLQGIKYTKHVWYQKNRERIIKKQTAYNNEIYEQERRQGLREKNHVPLDTLRRIRYNRDRIIKQDLLFLELATFQRRSNYMKKHPTVKVNFVGSLRHRPREILIGDIQKALRELELYEDQIKESHKYYFDYDDYDHRLDIFRLYRDRSTYNPF